MLREFYALGLTVLAIACHISEDCLVGNLPRGHHVVPAFYLAGFTKRRADKGKFFVYDRETDTTRPSKPINEARHRDFYRIASDEEPMLVENELSKMEGMFAGALQRLQDSGHVPTGRDHDLILNFIAIQAARTPTPRGLQRRIHDDTMKLIFETLADNPAAFENSKSQITEEGVAVSDLTHEDIVSLTSNQDQFRFEVDSTSLVLPMLELASELVPVLGGRHWMLYEACDDHRFVTCDNPIAMAPVGRPAPGWAPGFGRADTIVSAPLTSRYAYIGMPSNVPDRATATREDVAELNGLTATNAARFVYSQNDTFLWKRLNGTIVRSSEGNGPLLANLDTLGK